MSAWSGLGPLTASARMSRDLLPHPPGALVDLLDRVLDRGLVIDADIVVTLAGVPLVGISLRAAIAGIETMVQHGLLTDWDASIRSEAPVSTAPLAATEDGPDTRLSRVALPAPTVGGKRCQER